MDGHRSCGLPGLDAPAGEGGADATELDVYAYFNNEAAGDFAVANALGLKKRLGS